MGIKLARGTSTHINGLTRERYQLAYRNLGLLKLLAPTDYSTSS